MRSRRLSKGDDRDASDDGSVLSDDEPSASESASDTDSNDSGSGSGDHRKFVLPPPREPLPERTTRGKRMGALAVPEDDDADNEFWNQEFFAEEAADERYETESEPEDRFDQDFNDTEEDEDDEEEVEEVEDRNDFETVKKKVLKPPGSKKPPVKRPAPATDLSQSAPKTQQSKKPKVVPERTMSVRTSTKERVEQARAERKFIEETKGKRAYRRAEHKQLSQAELLAEAARTAIENTRSLMYMEAVEEENKRRATNNTGKYVGPMVSHHSFKGDDGEEHTVVRVKHTNFAPEYLEPQTLPALPTKDVCPVTNTVAKYRDPVTKLGYSTLDAFRKIRNAE